MQSDEPGTHYKSETVVIRTGVWQTHSAVILNHRHAVFEILDMKDIVFILTAENQPVAVANGASVHVLITICDKPCNRKRIT